MNTRISDAAVVLRNAAAVLDMWEGAPDETGYMGDFADACDILEILAQHADTPRPAKPEAVRLRDGLRERGTLAATLRAMATNYSGGHSWDHLDADVCRRAADALASVQPSPAGQGDAPWPEIDMILADAYSAGAAGLQFEGIARRSALRAALAASAANQPEYLHGSDELRARVDGERAAYMEGLEEGKLIGARQQVGQEPVGTVSYYSPMNFGGYMIQFASPTPIEPGTNLYAAPPAPAVDVEQFREAVQFFAAYTFPGTPSRADADRLLALIDSGKAVQS